MAFNPDRIVRLNGRDMPVAEALRELIQMGEQIGRELDTAICADLEGQICALTLREPTDAEIEQFRAAWEKGIRSGEWLRLPESDEKGGDG